MNFNYDNKIFWKAFMLILLLVIPFVILLHLTTESRVIDLVYWIVYTVFGSVAVSSYIDKEYLAKHLTIHEDFKMMYTGGKGHYFLGGMTVFMYLTAWVILFTEGDMIFFGGLFLLPMLFNLQIESRVLLADSKIHYMGKVVAIDENSKIKLLNRKIEVENKNAESIVIGATNKNIAKKLHATLQKLV